MPHATQEETSDMPAHRPRPADTAAGPLPQMPLRHKVTFGDVARRGGRGKLAGMDFAL